MQESSDSSVILLEVDDRISKNDLPTAAFDRNKVKAEGETVLTTTTAHIAQLGQPKHVVYQLKQRKQAQRRLYVFERKMMSVRFLLLFMNLLLNVLYCSGIITPVFAFEVGFRVDS